MKTCNTNIRKALEIADEMIRLSNDGDEHRDDDGCGVLYGIIRDSAYKIKMQAEKEMKKHKEKGCWE